MPKSKNRIIQCIDSRFSVNFYGICKNISIGDPDNEKKSLNDKDNIAISALNKIMSNDSAYENKEEIIKDLRKLRDQKLLRTYNKDKENELDNSDSSLNNLASLIFARLELERIVNENTEKNPILASSFKKLLFNKNSLNYDKVISSLMEISSQKETNRLIENILKASTEEELDAAFKMIGLDSEDRKNSEIHDEHILGENNTRTKPEIDWRIKNEFDDTVDGDFATVTVEDIEALNNLMHIQDANKDAIKKQVSSLKEQEKILFFDDTHEIELTNRIFAELELERLAKNLENDGYNLLTSKLRSKDINTHKKIIANIKTFENPVQYFEDAIKSSDDLKNTLNQIGIGDENIEEVEKEHYALQERKITYQNIISSATRFNLNILKNTVKEKDLREITNQDAQTAITNIASAKNKVTVETNLKILGIDDQTGINKIFGEVLYQKIIENQDFAKQDELKKLISPKINTLINHLGKLNDSNNLEKSDEFNLKLFIELLPNDDASPTQRSRDDILKEMTDENMRKLFTSGPYKDDVSKKETFPTERAEGNGNCAFNAFVLGFSREDVLTHFEKKAKLDKNKYDRFVHDASHELNVPTGNLYQEIKKLRQDEDGKITLQEKLAPVMRRLSCELASNDPKREHFNTTKEILSSAFVNYNQDSANVNKGDSDDIFTTHKFIRDKFNELSKIDSISDTNVYTELEEWWSAKGYNQFLTEMSANQEQWAGDLELKELATFFNVNLDIKKDKTTNIINRANGELDSKNLNLTDPEINELKNKNIVEHHIEEGVGKLYLLPHTEDEVKAILEESENISAERVSPILDVWNVKYKPAPIISLDYVSNSHYDLISTPPSTKQQEIENPKSSSEIRDFSFGLAHGEDESFEEISTHTTSVEPTASKSGKDIRNEFLESAYGQLLNDTSYNKTLNTLIINNKERIINELIKSRAFDSDKVANFFYYQDLNKIIHPSDNDPENKLAEYLYYHQQLMQFKSELIINFDLKGQELLHKNKGEIIDAFANQSIKSRRIITKKQAKNILEKFSTPPSLSEVTSKHEVSDSESSSEEEAIDIPFESTDTKKSGLVTLLEEDIKLKEFLKYLDTESKKSLFADLDGIKTSIDKGIINTNNTDISFKKYLENSFHPITALTDEIKDSMIKKLSVEAQYNFILKNADENHTLKNSIITNGKDIKHKLNNTKLDAHSDIMKFIYGDKNPEDIATYSELFPSLKVKSVFTEEPTTTSSTDDSSTEVIVTEGPTITSTTSGDPIIEGEGTSITSSSTAPSATYTASTTPFNDLNTFMNAHSYNDAKTTNLTAFTDILNNFASAHPNHAITEKINKYPPTTSEDFYKALKAEIKTFNKFADQFLHEERGYFDEIFRGSKEKPIGRLEKVTDLLRDQAATLMDSGQMTVTEKNRLIEDCESLRDKIEIVIAKLESTHDSKRTTEIADLETQIKILNTTIHALRTPPSDVRIYTQGNIEPHIITGATPKDQIEDFITALAPRTGTTTSSSTPSIDHLLVSTLNVEPEPSKLIKEDVFKTAAKENPIKIFDCYYINDKEQLNAYKRAHPGVTVESDGDRAFVRIGIGTGSFNNTHMGIANYQDLLKYLDEKEIQIMAARFVETTYNTLPAKDRNKPMSLSAKTDPKFAKAVIAYCRCSAKGHVEPRYGTIQSGKYKIDDGYFDDYLKRMKKNLGDPDTRERITGVKSGILFKDDKPEETKKSIEPTKSWFKH